MGGLPLGALMSSVWYDGLLCPPPNTHTHGCPAVTHPGRGEVGDLCTIPHWVPNTHTQVPPNEMHTDTHVCACMLSLQSCLTLCDPVDYSPPGSSVHGIFQARILEWVSMSSSRGSSRPRDQAHISCVSYTAGRVFTAEPSGKPRYTHSWTATHTQSHRHTTVTHSHEHHPIPVCWCEHTHTHTHTHTQTLH